MMLRVTNRDRNIDVKNKRRKAELDSPKKEEYSDTILKKQVDRLEDKINRLSDMLDVLLQGK